MQLHELVESLPASSLTTRVLGALDWIVPGEWKNITSYAEMVKDVTGEDDESLVQQVGERAIALYADPEQGYQRAVSVYKLIDSGSTVAGVASALRMIGERVDMLSFLESVTPKEETSQAIDASVKLVGELAAFCFANGLPGDSVGDFASAVGSYAKEEKIRLVSWLALDCVLPLGPDFLGKLLDAVNNFDASSLPDHRIFGQLGALLPGSLDDQKKAILSNVESVGGQLQNLAKEKELSSGSILERVRAYVDVSDDKLDALAAALDMTTNVFEHTGIQSVARRAISRAYGEI
jgi:hypothetical protein